MIHILATIFVLLTGGLAEVRANTEERVTTPEVKAALATLSKAKSENIEKLNVIDESIDKNMKNPLQPNFEVVMAQLITQRKEYLLRQNFLDRLHFMVQAYRPKDQFRKFIQDSLTHLASIEARSLQADEKLWKFLSYAARVAQDLPEKTEAVVPFVVGYMNFSSISEPIHPEKYLALIDYSNGYDNIPANPSNRDIIGELVEEKLARVEAKQAEDESRKDFTERKPILKSVFQIVEAVQIRKLQTLPEVTSDDFKEPSLLKPESDHEFDVQLIPKEEL